MNDLLDVNVWMALVDQRHTQHRAARQYWERNGDATFCFCRVTMLGFLRLLTAPQASSKPKTGDEAWMIYRQFLDLPNVCILPEPAELELVFYSLTAHLSPPSFFWIDAYLAAFTLAGKGRLVTFDPGFKRFSNLNLLLLKFS